MFLNIKTLKNGSSGDYDSVLINPNLLIEIEPVQIIDTFPGSAPQGAEAYPNMLDTVRLNLGDLYHGELFLKKSYGPEGAPSLGGGTANGTMSIPVVSQQLGAIFTGAIVALTLTITSLQAGSSGVVAIGQTLSGPGFVNSVAPNTIITGFVSGTLGGNGVYIVSIAQTVTTRIMSSSMGGGAGVSQPETISLAYATTNKLWTVTGSVSGIIGTITQGADTEGTAVTFYGGGQRFTLTQGSVAFVGATSTFTYATKNSLNQLMALLQYENYAGGSPVYSDVVYPTPAFAKINKIDNITEQSYSSAFSYVNPSHIAMVKSEGAYYLTAAPTATTHGNGTMTVPVIAPRYAQVDTYTVSFLTANTYVVTNSESVVIGTGTILNTAGSTSSFSGGGISFLLTNGATVFDTTTTFTITTTAGTLLVTTGIDNPDIHSSIPFATWVTGLGGVLDLETVTTQVLPTGPSGP